MDKRKDKLATITPPPKGENRGGTTRQEVKRVPALSKAVGKEPRQDIKKARP